MSNTPGHQLVQVAGFTATEEDTFWKAIKIIKDAQENDKIDVIDEIMKIMLKNLVE